MTLLKTPEDPTEFGIRVWAMDMARRLPTTKTGMEAVSEVIAAARRIEDGVRSDPEARCGFVSLAMDMQPPDVGHLLAMARALHAYLSASAKYARPWDDPGRRVEAPCVQPATCH